MTEPLAEGRDEVLYLACTHSRLRLHELSLETGRAMVMRATGSNFGSEIQWGPKPWARLFLPTHVQPSRVPWALIDPALETVEGLHPVGFDASRDPDGLPGQHRQELLAWIFDRHLEGDEATAEQRGAVEGGNLTFGLEYIGRSSENALLRPAGAHHKIPQILAHTLVYRPDLMMYLFPCELRVTTFDPDAGQDGSIEMTSLVQASEELSIPRELLVSAAEEMLIAWLGTPYNVSNTGRKRFPSSTSASRLSRHGFSVAGVDIQGLPSKTTIHGTNNAAGQHATFPGWRLPGSHKGAGMREKT